MTPTLYLVYAGVKMSSTKESGPRRDVRGIEFAKFCFADEVHDAVNEARRTHVLVHTVLLDDPIEVARLLHYGVIAPGYQK